MQQARVRGVVVGVIAVIGLGVLSGAKPGGIERMPGEIVLSEREQAEILRTADSEERARLAVLYAQDDQYLPVAYTRAFFRVDLAPDGSPQVREVGRSKPQPGSHLRLPDLRTAAASGSTGRYDLVATVGIGRLGGPGYRWVIANYFHWTGSSGIDACNVNEDSIASAWAGGLTLVSDAYRGFYQPFGSVISPLDIYRSDLANNLGVAWSFHELKQRGSQLCTNVNWGEGDAYISEPSWQSRSSNVSMKYVHTKGSTDYSIGFGLGGFGVGPSISVKPSDGNQWQAAAFASFNH
jgi:hypothetical protein